MLAHKNVEDYYSAATFYHSACQICLKASYDIQRCSLCKTVAYCSKEHQKNDWPSHKTLCKVIQDTNERLKPKCRNFEEWKEYRVALRLAWEGTLKRSLKPHEVFMTMFPRACAKCYSKENLYDCKQCLNVAYCSKEHEIAHLVLHTAFCNELKLGLIVDQYLSNNGMADVRFVPNSHCIQFPENTKAFTKYLDCDNIFEEKQTFLNDTEKRAAVDILKTSLIAPGLSILYGLQITKIYNHNIIIHIVGVSLLEFTTNWPVVTDILKFWLNNIKLTYYLIGPEVSQYQLKDTETENYKVKYYNCFYHQIVDHIEKPDLVVAFNCGFHEFVGETENSWKSSIPMLLKYPHVPLLITSYTELEIERDIKEIVDLGLELNIILKSTKNPYLLLKPIRDWCSENTPIFYQNNYIFIVEKLSVMLNVCK